MYRAALRVRLAPGLETFVLISVFLVSVSGCTGSAPAPATGRSLTQNKPALPTLTPERVTGREPRATLRFRDISESAGVNFQHVSGMDSERNFPTNFGSGLALIDYDADGRLDLYLANTRNFPLKAPSNSSGNRLYRNRGDNTFEDVTAQAGVGFQGFNHGVTVGDVDSDGFPDLFLTNYGPNVLYLNNGDGTFRDATHGSGLEGPPWSTGAAFLDFDGDGDLDLYVSCYGEWSAEGEHPFCGDPKRKVRIYCSPFSLTPVRHHLYKNRGDGTFEEVTESAGINRKDGRGLGVVAADVNRDGLTDLYVANDGCPNFLFLNRGAGRFEDASESSGAALNEAGEVQGSMGVDVEDVDGDGWPELFVTNFRGQYNTLYKNHRGINFQDVSARADIIADSLLWVGWGCALADFDNDGLPDMFVVNGEVDDNLQALGQESPFEEPAFVWRNQGEGHFQVERNAGSFFSKNHVARGAAFGDLDNDGRLDAVVGLFDGAPVLLMNDSPPRSWIRLELLGTASNRSAIGAAVEVHAGGRVIHRQVKGGGSFLSAHDHRLLIGLGSAERVDRVEVRWPGGRRSTLERPPIATTHQVREPRAISSGESPR